MQIQIGDKPYRYRCPKRGEVIPCAPGEVVDLPEKFAQSAVKGGLASVYAGVETKGAEPEATQAPEVGEEAVEPKPKPKRRKRAAKKKTEDG